MQLGYGHTPQFLMGQGLLRAALSTKIEQPQTDRQAVRAAWICPFPSLGKESVNRYVSEGDKLIKVL